MLSYLTTSQDPYLELPELLSYLHSRSTWQNHQFFLHQLSPALHSGITSLHWTGCVLELYIVLLFLINIRIPGLTWAHHNGEVILPLVSPASPPDRRRWRWRYQGETNIRQGRQSKLQIVCKGKIMIINYLIHPCHDVTEV